MQIRIYMLTLFFSSLWNVIVAQPLIESNHTLALDTTVNYLDFLGKYQSIKYANFIRKSWREDDKTRMIIYEISSGNFIRKGWYTDASLTEKSGVFEGFHPNGMKRDSGRIEGKMREGTFITWHDNGALSSIRHFKNDILVDTGKAFDREGNLILISVTNKQGNGIETAYYPNGRISQKGNLLSGKKEGSWVVNRADGSRKMQLEFSKDIVIQANCFESNGKTPAAGNCVYEKPAEFPGGAQAWAQFLKSEQIYPEFAIEKDIQGAVVVVFNVEKDGSFSDIKVIYSPHEVLSKEVFRIMGLSPKWEPAIKLNDFVQFKQTLAINFQMNKQGKN